jgi:hypothetical protein
MVDLALHCSMRSSTTPPRWQCCGTCMSTGHQCGYDREDHDRIRAAYGVLVRPGLQPLRRPLLAPDPRPRVGPIHSIGAVASALGGGRSPGRLLALGVTRVVGGHKRPLAVPVDKLPVLAGLEVVVM